MNVAGFSFGLILVTFLFHVLLWRIRLPQAHTRTLLAIFMLALPLALLANQFLAMPTWLRIHGLWEHAQVCLFHVAMSLAYIEFYPSIEGNSPSCTVLLFVAQAGQQGRREEEVYSVIDDTFIVGDRLQAMVDGGFARRDGDVYRLTTAGYVWARLFHLARSLYRLELGG